MVFELIAGGHRFDFIRGVCMRCEMSREKFEDSGQPQCTGQSLDRRKRLTVPSDNDPPEVA